MQTVSEQFIAITGVSKSDYNVNALQFQIQVYVKEGWVRIFVDQWFTHLFSSIHLLVLILTPTTPTPNFPRHAKLQMNIDTDFSLKFNQTQNQLLPYKSTSDFNIIHPTP